MSEFNWPSLSVSSGPIQFTKNAVNTTVSQDTTTPANSIPLPVTVLDTTGVPTNVATSANQVSVQGSVAPGTAATKSNLVGGVYSSTLPTLTNGQQAALLLDSSSRLVMTSTDGLATGTITANGQTVVLTVPPGSSAWSIQLAGTFSAGSTVTWEGSDDGTTFVSVNGRQTGTGNGLSVLTTTSTGPGPFTYRGNLSTFQFFRVRCTAYQVADAIAVTIKSSTGVGAVFLNSAIPGGINVIGKVGIDQTTPGTTNGVQVVAALPAGTSVIGKVSIDQTTPGTTNLVALAANQSVNVAQINGVTPLMGNGVTGTGSQRVTIASDNSPIAVTATLQTGAAVIGSLVANQSVNQTQINGVAVLTGNGVTGTGSQRVTIASDNTPYAVKIDQTTPGTTNLVALAANQSVNQTQLNGVAVLAGNGVTGTGSMRVTIASDQTAFSVLAKATGKAQANAPVRNDYTTTSVTTGAYVQLVASTTSATTEIEIFDSSGQTLYLATGAAAAEVNQILIFPGGNGRVPLTIAAGTRVSVKAVSATANVGELDINFYN